MQIAQKLISQLIHIPQEAQWAGAIVMIIIVLALAWYGQRKWKGEATASQTPPA